MLQETEAKKKTTASRGVIIPAETPSIARALPDIVDMIVIYMFTS